MPPCEVGAFAEVEFSIDAWPSELDRLAVLLEHFSRLKHSVLEWTVDAGELEDLSPGR